MTLMFTDVVGSTGLVDRLQEEYPAVVERHRTLLRETTMKFGGSEVDASGDAFFGAFDSVRNAVRAAVSIQLAFARESWPAAERVAIRMGLHTGEPRLVDGRYYGLDVHIAARIAATANAGQVLLSAATRHLTTERDLPAGVVVRDLGVHFLKDIRSPEVLYDLEIPGADRDFGPIRSLTNFPNNLPTALTTFVGREVAVRDVCKIVRRRGTRMLTLTGPGGVGKTRLSIAAAVKLAPAFPDGTFQVELAAIRASDLVIPTIVETLGVTQFGKQGPLESLERKIGAGRVLLVLDNFEHLRKARSELLHLLEKCINLKVIVTSREALGLGIEKEYSVQPLGIPGVDDVRIEQTESGRLLIDRIREFKPNFDAAANAAALATICKEVDGLPLALELAASRLKVLTPEALANKLTHRLGVLKGASRDLPERQRTLRNCIDWSYELLSVEERQLFVRLCVFSGGFSLASAHEVCAHEHAQLDVLDRLESLVNKSLMTQEMAQGEPRFRMLETLREYGHELLASGDDRDYVMERHAAHFVRFAETMAPGLVTAEYRRSAAALQIEADNIRAALRRGLEHKDARMTSRLLASLLWLWVPQAQFAEARSWAGKAREAFADVGESRERGLILEVAGWIELLAGDYLGALPHLEESYRMLMRLGTPRDIARIKTALGGNYAILGNAMAEQLTSEALALCKELDDLGAVALALTAVGLTHHEHRTERAAEYYEQALVLFRQIGNVYWPGQLLQNLAQFHLRAGQRQSAAKLLVEVFELAREGHYPMIANLSIAVMGGVALARGMAQEAAQLFGAVDASLARLGVALEPPDKKEMERYVLMAQEQLGSEAFALAHERGARASDQETASLVLSVGAHVGDNP